MLIRYFFIFDFVDYSRKTIKSFDVLTGDQELQVRMASYEPEIDKSQHAKSVAI